MSREAQDESLVIEETWNLRYQYSTGPVTGYFLRSLAEGRIMGRRCPACGVVWLPPRAYCERCFIPTDEWVPVGPEGVLEACTIVNFKVPNLPDPPYAIAICRLDGADTGLLNFLDIRIDDIETVMTRLRPGARVRVKFRENRSARITDFCFELVE